MRGVLRTIPAPAKTICPNCRLTVDEGSKDIVRFNTQIHHRVCFMRQFFKGGHVNGDGSQTLLTKRFELQIGV